MKKIEIIEGEDPLQLLKRCDGYYERPEGGPLVGYAGRYGPEQKQFVGMVYANFAKGERKGNVLMHVAQELIRQHPDISSRADGFCAAPEGGKALASVLAAITGKDYIFPEKEIIALKTSSSREKSRLVWGRHEPEKGEYWWIVEDTCNNFSTTEEMIGLIESKGAHVWGIVCFLNRSTMHQRLYDSPSRPFQFPIEALVRKKIVEYQQHDLAVIADIQAGNVVWKPKNGWKRLADAMARAAEMTQWRQPAG